MGLRLNRDLLRSASRIAIAAGAAAFLSGCSGGGILGAEQPAAAAAIAAFESNDPQNQDYAAAAAYWGAKYEANRGDLKAAISFARNLRLMGGARQAVAVLKEIVMKAPDDATASSEYGKALTAVGRSKDAIPFLARATQMDGTDWSTFSAYGVALDQGGNHEAARQNYEIALKLSPGNATVESNMAMSYILTGRIDQAQTILRRLVSSPDATPQMRQNLAMIASLKGNSAEAEQLAREDLPAEQVTNNLAVLRQLDADNVKAPIAPVPEAVTAPVAEAVDIVPVEESKEIAESAIIETAPVVTAGSVPTPAEATPSSPRYQMAPIADDAAKPTAITPKPAAIQKTGAAKPAAQPAQSSMLRKSQESISIANVGE